MRRVGRAGLAERRPGLAERRRDGRNDERDGRNDERGRRNDERDGRNDERDWRHDERDGRNVVGRRSRADAGLQNGTFNTNTAGWTPSAGATATWNMNDSSGSAQSGSLDLKVTADSQAAAVQCISAVAGATYQFQAETLLPAGGSGYASLWFYSSNDCSGVGAECCGFDSVVRHDDRVGSGFRDGLGPVEHSFGGCSPSGGQARRSGFVGSSVRQRFGHEAMTGKPWSPRLSSPGLWIGLVWGVALAGAPGCGRPGGPSAFSASHPEFPIPDSGVVTPPPPVIAVQMAAPACTPARTSAPNAFPARTTIVGDAPSAAQQNNTYRTADLFSLFKSVCGGCHVDATDGGFQVTQGSFSTIVKGAMGTMVLGLIKSNDLATNMPPYNVAYDSRLSSDAVVQLATLLETWLVQGSPLTSFTLATQTSAPSAGYSMSPSLAAGLTNIGSCVPNKPAVGTSARR